MAAATMRSRGACAVAVGTRHVRDTSTKGLATDRQLLCASGLLSVSTVTKASLANHRQWASRHHCDPQESDAPDRDATRGHTPTENTSNISQRYWRRNDQ